jgi:mannose-6-phosphate isomerase-like protein (cupin superfamily)
MTYGIVQIDAGKDNPLHLHPNCDEYLHVISGSCEHVVGDKKVILKEGDVIRIPRGVPHKAKTLGKEPCKAVIVYNTGERQVTMLEKDGKE